MLQTINSFGIPETFILQQGWQQCERITLIEGDKEVSEDREVAETFKSLWKI